MKRSMRKLFCVCLLLMMLCVSAQAVFALQKVNINTASVAELVVLKGIGEKTAQSIIEYRKTHGDFKVATDLINVKGIGEKTFSRLADQITVGMEKTKE